MYYPSISHLVFQLRLVSSPPIHTGFTVALPYKLTSLLGESTFMDGVRLTVTANFVTCLGAPKLGMMNALLSGEGQSWQLSVADIGISQVVWRKYGTRRRHGVDFGNRWVVPLLFQASTPTIA